MKISNKQIVKKGEFNIRAQAMYKRWSTHEGLLTFFGRDNKIELAPGGAFEIYFLMDNPHGLRGSEGCKVLSYLPDKMISFSWNAPPEYKEVRDSEYHTWVVVEFNSIANSKTEVVITHLGWPEDEQWNRVYEYFNKAWDQVLVSLLKSIDD